VIGDPLETIASGPTVVRAPERVAEDAVAAREILHRLIPDPAAIPAGVLVALQRESTVGQEASEPSVSSETSRQKVVHLILGNNRKALEAAAVEATARGFHVLDLRPEESGEAAAVGRSLAEEARAIRAVRDAGAPPCCLITGGEPVVRL